MLLGKREFAKKTIVKYLGVLIGSKLSPKDHISAINKRPLGQWGLCQN